MEKLPEDRPCPGYGGVYCGETDILKFRYIRPDCRAPACKECERKRARERRKAQYHDPKTQSIIKAQNKAYSSKPERKEISKIRSHEIYLANIVKLIIPISL